MSVVNRVLAARSGVEASAGDVHVVELSGPLNLRRALEVSRLFRRLAVRGAERVVVDLDDVPFIDGWGLAALIAGYELFGSQAGNFRLAGLQDQPRLVLELTGYDGILLTGGHPESEMADVWAMRPYIQVGTGALAPLMA
jgi:anti-anti-sigma factor